MKKSLLILIMFMLMLGTANGSRKSSQLRLDTAMGHPLLLAGKTQTDYLKVGLTGFEMEKTGKRTPVNIAIVIDKSGSMSGQKIEKAKEAAIMAIGRLRADDIISVVTYDSDVWSSSPRRKYPTRTLYFAG